jgi:hypothetical protein
MIATSTVKKHLSVLDDAFWVIERPDGVRATWSFPLTLAHLLADEDPVRSYPGLAAEQASHWHRFQVRCAAKALRVMSVRPEQLIGGNADALAAELRAALADAAGSADAWGLWSDNPAGAAFLQAPVFGGGAPESAGYMRRPIADLTALIGSKEFERKSEAVRYMTALEVAYALIEFQGGVIFGGRGNYETQLTPSRSGKGSGVPFMSVRFPLRSGDTFRWGVRTVLDGWDAVQRTCGLRGDRWALWTLPWDADTPLPAAELDPSFLPMARLIRLRAPDEHGRFSNFVFKPSNASRVSDHTEGAMLGDPFTPTVPHPKRVGQYKVRGVMESGFTYPEVADLLGLGERGAPSPAVQAFFERGDSESIANVRVVFDGLAFEQGKTLGFFRRELPLPVDATTTLLFSNPDPLRRVHAHMLATIGQAKKILRAASRIVLHGEPRPGAGDDAVASQAPLALDGFAEDSDQYFRFLFAAGSREAAGDDQWQLEWADQVAAWARSVFDTVLPRLPAPGAQRLARETNALDYLDWKLRDLGAGHSASSE